MNSLTSIILDYPKFNFLNLRTTSSNSFTDPDPRHFEVTDPDQFKECAREIIIQLHKIKMVGTYGTVPTEQVAGFRIRIFWSDPGKISPDPDPIGTLVT